jgi:tRNA threonylcarbamoyladenosine biosynthesis protein TsaB
LKDKFKVHAMVSRKIGAAGDKPIGTKILGLDSATSACSAAIVIDGQLVSRRFEPMTRGQSEVLVPMIEQVLEQAGLEVNALNLIAVTVGPGAFTGLRIAIATALGLSLASGVRAAGVTTTQAIAYGARAENPEPSQIITALDSKRDDIYLQAFSADGSDLGEVEAVASGAVNGWLSARNLAGPITLIGDAAERVLEILDPDHASHIVRGQASAVPDAAHVAALAAERIFSGAPLQETRPFYLRPPDATIPKNGGRLRD